MSVPAPALKNQHQDHSNNNEEMNHHNEEEKVNCKKGEKKFQQNEAVNFYNQLRIKYLNRSDGNNFSDSNSSFASESDSDPFQLINENKDEETNDNMFSPIYRYEYGGVLIYDINTTIPGQPVPPFDCEHFSEQEQSQFFFKTAKSLSSKPKSLKRYIKYEEKDQKYNNIKSDPDIPCKELPPPGNNNCFSRTIHGNRFRKSNNEKLTQNTSQFRDKNIEDNPFNSRSSNILRENTHRGKLKKVTLENSQIAYKGSYKDLPNLSFSNDAQSKPSSKLTCIFKSKIRASKDKDLKSQINETLPDKSLFNKPPNVKGIINKKVTFQKNRTFGNDKRKIKLVIPPDDQLPVRFESRFENGNLKKAVKISDTEYNLILNFDYNTGGHTQWFYFKAMTKLSEGTEVKFNILNLMKPDSLYNYGMKPCVRSRKRPGRGWHRDCHDIKYFRNNILRNRNKIPGEGVKSRGRLAQYYFFTLSFTYTLRVDNDDVSFAHAVPYTYNGNLLPFLQQIGKEPKFHNYLRIGTLCKTLARNDCKMMIITEDISTYRDCTKELKWMMKHQHLRKNTFNKVETEERFLEYQINKSVDKPHTKKLSKLEKDCRKVYRNHRHKKGIVISSRVHPGEAQSSWVVQGFIEFLLSNDPIAVELRRNYIFKIIPMLNPDGVIYGNYRCSLLGFDLNRRWLDPNKQLDPTIYFAKRMIKVFQEEREVQLYCDLHGHSRKKNAFMYGCDHSYNESRYNNFLLRIFPAIFSHINPVFQFEKCNFKCEKAKERTGRIVCFKELGINHSFTQETTFYGRDGDKDANLEEDLHMSITDFKILGADLAKTISFYLNPQFCVNLQNESLKLKIDHRRNVINPGSLLADVSTNAAKLDNLESRPQTSYEVTNKETVIPEGHHQIFVKVMQSLNISYEKPEEDSDNETFSSSSEDEDADLIHDQLKDLNTDDKDDKPYREFRIRNRQSKTTILKAKMKARQIEAKQSISQNKIANTHTVSSASKASQRQKIKEGFDKSSEIKTPILRHQSLKKQTPYGISVIDNFNIQLFDRNSREIKSPLVTMQKSISSCDCNQKNTTDISIDNRQRANNINIKISDDLNNYNINVKNTAFQDVQDRDSYVQPPSYSKPISQMKNHNPEFCISGATIHASIDRYPQIEKQTREIPRFKTRKFKHGKQRHRKYKKHIKLDLNYSNNSKEFQVLNSSNQTSTNSKPSFDLLKSLTTSQPPISKNPPKPPKNPPKPRSKIPPVATHISKNPPSCYNPYTNTDQVILKPSGARKGTGLKAPAEGSTVETLYQEVQKFLIDSNKK
ncbi:unnamed protein product [Moneuplotes crassus]|uniref:Peptidase M14 domain-containing protein n=1 Tax=Euplotes crassus TaxID=5936 RepID=A0AAD1U3Y4_EUPCR|nr:unnamed protein product [Moneuplotes crassus]